MNELDFFLSFLIVLQNVIKSMSTDHSISEHERFIFLLHLWLNGI